MLNLSGGASIHFIVAFIGERRERKQKEMANTLQVRGEKENVCNGCSGNSWKLTTLANGLVIFSHSVQEPTLLCLKEQIRLYNTQIYKLLLHREVSFISKY